MLKLKDGNSAIEALTHSERVTVRARAAGAAAHQRPVNCRVRAYINPMAARLQSHDHNPAASDGDDGQAAPVPQSERAETGKHSGNYTARFHNRRSAKLGESNFVRLGN